MTPTSHGSHGSDGSRGSHRPSFDPEGAAVLVTGAGRGLGAALAHRLAAAGARVALVARNADPLEEVAARIRAAGGEAHALVADLGDPAAALAVAGAAAALVGPVDLLVHAASELGPIPLALLLDTDAATFERVLQVNVLAPFRLTKAIAGSMALRQRGLVVHVTSDASVAAYERWGAYGVSKAALDHLARVWAVELEPTGVRFLSLDPGEMDTRMHADAIPDADRSTLAQPDAVAASILRILSHANRFPTGARVEVATAATALPAEAARDTEAA